MGRTEIKAHPWLLVVIGSHSHISSATGSDDRGERLKALNPAASKRALMGWGDGCKAAVVVIDTAKSTNDLMTLLGRSSLRA
jgi:hypothetical protein